MGLTQSPKKLGKRGRWQILRTVHGMKASGSRDQMSDKVKGVKFGQTGLSMKDGGMKTKPMARGD